MQARDIEDMSGDDKGLILSGGLKDAGKSTFLWNFELGVVKFDDSDGAAFEFTLGLRVSFYRYAPCSARTSFARSKACPYARSSPIIAAR